MIEKRRLKVVQARYYLPDTDKEVTAPVRLVDLKPKEVDLGKLRLEFISHKNGDIYEIYNPQAIEVPFIGYLHMIEPFNKGVYRGEFHAVWFHAYRLWLVITPSEIMNTWDEFEKKLAKNYAK